MALAAVLPAAGLLLRFGDQDVLNISIIKDAGGVVFDNLPLILVPQLLLGPKVRKHVEDAGEHVWIPEYEEKIN